MNFGWKSLAELTLCNPSKPQALKKGFFHSMDHE